MTYITKINLARQAKLYSGEVSILSGSINLGENFTVSGNTFLPNLIEYDNPSNLLGLGINNQITSIPSSFFEKPIGKKGQILKIKTNDSSNLLTQDTILTGNFITNDQELDNAKLDFKTQLDIFSTWKRFAHGNANPSDQAAGTKGNNIPGLPQSTNAWSYNPTLDRISSTFNSWCMLGFISDIKVNKYIHRATVSSSAEDNDKIGLVIAFFEDYNDLVLNTAFGLNPSNFDWPINVTDQYIPNQHALTLIRNREGVNITYVVYYDYGKTTEKIIVNGSDLVWNTQTTWSNREVDLEVNRDGDLIIVKTSQMSDAPGGKGVLSFPLEIDLNSDPDLLKFKGYNSYGYACQSQALSYFKNISISAGLTSINEIYDLRNGNIWVSNSGGTYSISNRNLWNELQPMSIVRNIETGKYIYVDENYEYDIINKPNETIPFASTTTNGIVSTTMQDFGGIKNFKNVAMNKNIAIGDGKIQFITGGTGFISGLSSGVIDFTTPYIRIFGANGQIATIGDNETLGTEFYSSKITIGRNYSSVSSTLIERPLSAASVMSLSGITPPNSNAANLILRAGSGLGSSTAGDIIFQTADVTTSGITAQSYTTKITLKKDGQLQLNKQPLLSNLGNYNLLTINNNTGNVEIINPSGLTTSFTASNGVKKIGNDIQLGGILTSNLQLDKLGIAPVQVTVQDGTFRVQSEYSGFSNSSFNQYSTSTIANSTFKLNNIVDNWSGTMNIISDQNENSISMSIGLTSGIRQAITFKFDKINEDGNTMVIKDLLDTGGLRNEGDYEDYFVSRSLVTKQYVDNLISSGGDLNSVLTLGNSSNKSIVLIPDNPAERKSGLNMYANGGDGVSASIIEHVKNYGEEFFSGTAHGITMVENSSGTYTQFSYTRLDEFGLGETVVPIIFYEPNGTNIIAEFDGKISIASGTEPTHAVALQQLIYRYQASGNGSSTTITIPHGLTGLSGSSDVIAVARNLASADIKSSTIDGTNIYIVYSVAPVSGTNNLSYAVSIRP